MGTFTSELTFGQYYYGTMVESPGISYKTIQIGNQPSIQLDFTTGTLDPRITFARASSGTYFNSSGVLATATTNVARFDYDPATLAAKGLLIEEARTNLILYSDLLTTNWETAAGSQALTLTANAATSPDGTTNAAKLDAGAVSAAQYSVRRQGIVLAVATYCFSVYAKAFAAGDVGKALTLYQNDGTTKGVSNYSLTNTWARASSSAGLTAAACYPSVGSLGASFGGTTQGAVSSNIWRAQLEAGLFPTSSIYTTSASATRAADIATMTGSNFSSWWIAATGTIAVQATSPASGTRVVWQTDDGTANNRITIYTTGTTVMADVVSGGVTQASLNLGTITADTAFKVAMRYGANDFSASLNGAACVTDTGGTVPTVDRCRLGADTTGNYLCGTLARVTAYLTGLSDSDLRSLST